MWIYYYAKYGPGHQSRDTDFVEFNNDCDDELIEECLYNRIDSNGYQISLSYWKVKRPPFDFVKSKAKSIEEKIDRLKNRLESLKSQKCFKKEQEEGEDPVLKDALKGKFNEDVLYHLHKNGFMYTDRDISNWYHGKKKVDEPHRTAILNIIKKAKSYNN